MMSQAAISTLISLEAPRISDMTDEQLIALARANNPPSTRAWTVLISRHRGWLARLLSGMLGEHDAEDILQDVFVRVFISLEEYRGGSFHGWLRQIAQRTAFNWVRDKSTARRYEAGAGEGEDELSPITPQDLLGNRDHFQKIFSSLTVEDREVLTLRYASGLDTQALADALGVSLSAAKMRLKRARLRFKLAFHADEEVHTTPMGSAA